MEKVVITRKIPQPAEEMLSQRYDVFVNPHDRAMTKEELLAEVRDASALLPLLSDRIDAEIINSAEKLKVIANYAAGYNNIDIKAATEKGIVVTNTPDALTETTADLTWALILAVARRIVEGDRFMRSGKFRGWEPELLLGTDVYGKTLGIVGFGRIGQAVARRAKGFNMRILYYSRTRKPELERELGAQFVPLEKLMAESDFISIHTPLTEATRGLISSEMLDLMKPSAYLINTARGEVIDEKHLIEMLRQGRIKGAALDVFYGEPEVNPDLFELENVIITPHIGSASAETRSRMASMAAESIIDVLSGRRPRYVVNPDVYKKQG